MSTLSRAVYAPSLARNQSLQRAVVLLRALAERPEGASAAVLARVTGLPRPTTGRLLATLADVGLVERSPGDEGWVIGPEAARLGRAANPYRRLSLDSQPLLRRLAEEAGESAMLAVVRYTEVEVVAQANPPRLLGMTDWVGRPLTGLHASAGGKLLLAQLEPDALARWVSERELEDYTARTLTSLEDLQRELERVRRSGWAESVDELENGLTSVAVVVTNNSAYPALCIGVSGPSARLSADRRHELLASIRLASRTLAELIA